MAMSKITDLIVLLQVIAASFPVWMYLGTDVGFEFSVLIAIGWATAYVAILTGRVVEVREAMR
jgi:hypothetical protein